MEKEKRKVEEYEASLDKEEKVLEGIRDSLKGVCLSSLLFRYRFTCCTDQVVMQTRRKCFTIK